jgi:leucyl aminopeptidase (aminopeptidase T)
MDRRARKLAKIFVEHSVKVKKGDKVMIIASDFSAVDLVKACYELCLKKGAHVHLALGKSYESKRGGGKNEGSIHWDLIKDLRHKGSSVLVDDREIIKDGKVFV